MTQPTSPAIPSEVRERVIAAAVELYDQADRQGFPTVDAVRRLSRADMNTVSSVMKEWRQAQTKKVENVVVAVPEQIKQTSDKAVADLWQKAKDLANESLSNAQDGWEIERGRFEDMRIDLSNSYEAKAAEFDAAKKQLTESEAKTTEQAQHLAAVRQSEAEAANRAERAEARAADLRAELDRSIQETDRQRSELAEARAKAEAATAATEATRAELATVKAQAAEQAKQATAEAQRTTDRLAKMETDRDQVRAELATAKAKAEAADLAHQEQRKTAAAEALRTVERMTQAEADRDTARKQASTAREEAARTAGKLEAMQTQAASLIDALAARQEAPAPEVAAKPAAKTAKKS